MLRALLDWLGVFVYLDAAILDFAIQKKPIGYTLGIALIVSNVQILIAFGVFTGIAIWVRKKLFPRINSDTKEFLIRLTKWLKRWRNSEVAQRWAERLGKIQRYRYLILFSLNLVPFFPWLTTSTAIAASLSKRKWVSLFVAMAGNAVKFFIFVPLFYYLT